MKRIITVVIILLGLSYVLIQRRYGNLLSLVIAAPTTHSGETYAQLSSLRSNSGLWKADGHAMVSVLDDPEFLRYAGLKELPRFMIETLDGCQHWYQSSNTVSYFKSRQQADDRGNWGFVNDPNSLEFGTIFVNCTHKHFCKQAQLRHIEKWMDL